MFSSHPSLLSFSLSLTSKTHTPNPLSHTLDLHIRPAALDPKRAFAVDSPFWTEHDYFALGSGFFSYLEPLSCGGEPGAEIGLGGGGRSGSGGDNVTGGGGGQGHGEGEGDKGGGAVEHVMRVCARQVAAVARRELPLAFKRAHGEAGQGPEVAAGMAEW